MSEVLDLEVAETVSAMDVSTVRWDRTVFYHGVTSHVACPEVIDLTGVPRHVVFGPFMVLKPGLWRATITFEICEDAARRHLFVDFGGDGDFSAVELPCGFPGMKSVSIVHNFVEGIRAEARVYLAKAAFHGYLRFFGAELQRLD